MLRTGESCLANRTFVIPGHGLLDVAVAVAKRKKSGPKKTENGRFDRLIDLVCPVMDESSLVRILTSLALATPPTLLLDIYSLSPRLSLPTPHRFL
jgi:hypothetical protein